ncbi:MAG: methyltransferase domain-containing protein [Rhizobiales bacterium]|nr:methyltransferase domain-containing protein [Hyphomicrobiales bacterium]
MLYSHLIFNQISKDDKVLDIGGAAQPFRRANYVVDILPYEKRYQENSFMMDLPEHFSKDTWIVQDVCDPLPFEDQTFDFVVCGHLLEDIRDPISVVKEMQRVSKRGYIEVPSRYYEQLSGLEFPGMLGASHHHWVTDLRYNEQTNENELVFLFKKHSLHFSPELQIKKTRAARNYPYVGPHYETLAILWDGPFTVKEDIEAAIESSNEFFLSTVDMAKELGDELFNKNQKLLVEGEIEEPFKGAKSLEEISWEDSKTVQPYDEFRGLTPDLKKYEYEALTKLGYEATNPNQASATTNTIISKKQKIKSVLKSLIR